MKLKEVLQRLSKYGITVAETRLEPDGSQTFVIAGRLPSPPFGSKHMAFYTLNVASEEEEVSLEEREAIRRRMWHLTTDIFGDDALKDAEDLSTEVSDSHFHALVPKPN